MPWIYLTLEQAIDIHAKTVEVSGGGSTQQVEIGKLEAVLQNIQNDDYYPTFEAKITHLFFCACKFHSFLDGNKRIAIALCAAMISMNGFFPKLTVFIRESENISYHVAAGGISKELLGEWIQALFAGREDDESLKLKLMNAMAGEPQQ